MLSFYEKLLKISNFTSARNKRQIKKNRRGKIVKNSGFSFGFDRGSLKAQFEYRDINLKKTKNKVLLKI